MVKYLRLNVVSLHDDYEGDYEVNRDKTERDIYGRTPEFYEDMNMEIPEHMFDKFEEEDDEDEFYEDEAETIMAFPTILDLDEFSFCINNSSLGSSLFTKGGEIITVYETSDQIYAQIEELNRSWFQRLINKFKKDE